jgi:hypothetical protein
MAQEAGDQERRIEWHRRPRRPVRESKRATTAADAGTCHALGAGVVGSQDVRRNGVDVVVVTERTFEAAMLWVRRVSRQGRDDTAWSRAEAMPLEGTI